MIATAGFIVSADIVKVHLGIGTTGADTWLDKALASITKKIETYCSRTFIATHYSAEYHDGDGKRGFFFVKNPPVISISELNLDINRNFAAATAYATSEYIIYDDEGRVELLDTGGDLTASLAPVVFGKGQQNIKIVYTGGYTTIPEDVAYGATEWISKLYHRRDKKRWDISAKSKGDVSASFIAITSMPKEIKEYIDPYRLSGFMGLHKHRR